MLAAAVLQLAANVMRHPVNHDLRGAGVVANNLGIDRLQEGIVMHRIRTDLRNSAVKLKDLVRRDKENTVEVRGIRIA